MECCLGKHRKLRIVTHASTDTERGGLAAWSSTQSQAPSCSAFAGNFSITPFCSELPTPNICYRVSCTHYAEDPSVQMMTNKQMQLKPISSFTAVVLKKSSTLHCGSMCQEAVHCCIRKTCLSSCPHAPTPKGKGSQSRFVINLRKSWERRARQDGGLV